MHWVRCVELRAEPLPLFSTHGMSTTNSARVFVSLFIVGFLAFTAPSTTYAAWWNPLDWFSKTETTREQPLPQRDEQQSNIPAESVEVSTKTDTPAPTVAQQPVAAPIVNDSQNAETITALRAEVATLKASLDNLYAAHSGLVNDHNALLEYTKSIAAQKTPTTVVQQVDTSAIERRVSELERKAKLVSDELYGGGSSNVESTLNSICAWVFGSSIISGCPSSNPNGIGSIDSRLEKLERGL